MTERLLAKIDRLGAEAGIETMTPEIRKFALLVRQDLVSQWPQRPWVGLTDEDVDNFLKATWGRGVTAEDFIRVIEAKLKEKNT
jgi:hypothetical protein